MSITGEFVLDLEYKVKHSVISHFIIVLSPFSVFLRTPIPSEEFSAYISENFTWYEVLEMDRMIEIPSSKIKWEAADWDSDHEKDIVLVLPVLRCNNKPMETYANLMNQETIIYPFIEWELIITALFIQF